MKEYYSKFLCFFAITFLISCGKSEQMINTENERKLEKENKRKIEDSNEKSISNMIMKYKAYSGLDTFNNYTYILQNMLINEGKNLSFHGKINDIIKIDSSNLLNIYNFNFTGVFSINYQFLAFISDNIFNEFVKKIESGNYSKSGCFILKVTKIKSISPKINFDLGEDNAFLDLDFNEKLLIFEGELVDYHLYKIKDFN